MSSLCADDFYLPPSSKLSASRNVQRLSDWLDVSMPDQSSSAPGKGLKAYNVIVDIAATVK